MSFFPFFSCFFCFCFGSCGPGAISHLSFLFGRRRWPQGAGIPLHCDLGSIPLSQSSDEAWVGGYKSPRNQRRRLNKSRGPSVAHRCDGQRRPSVKPRENVPGRNLVKNWDPTPPAFVQIWCKTGILLPQHFFLFYFLPLFVCLLSPVCFACFVPLFPSSLLRFSVFVFGSPPFQYNQLSLRGHDVW